MKIHSVTHQPNPLTQSTEETSDHDLSVNTEINAIHPDSESGVMTYESIERSFFPERDLRDIRELKFSVNNDEKVSIPEPGKQASWFLRNVFASTDRIVIQARHWNEESGICHTRQADAGFILRHREAFKEKNQQGFGILVSTQPRQDDFFVPGRTGKKVDVKQVRNIVLELDGKEGLSPFESLKKLAESGFPKPTVVVKSSPGKYHVWYSLTNPLPIEEGEKLIARLVKFCSADPAAKDVTRFLRLPDFQNTKPENKNCLCQVVLAGKKVRSDLLESLLPKEEEKFSPPAPALMVSGDFPELKKSTVDKVNPALASWLRKVMHNPKTLYYPGVSRQIIAFLSGEVKEHEFHISLVKSTYFLRKSGVSFDNALQKLQELYPEKLGKHLRTVHATWQKQLL